MPNIIAGKSILITGGTGSFGSIMMETLLDLNPKEIIIFSRDELKQYDMRNKYNSPLLRFVIGDVRDPDSVGKVMKGVDYVFHAAALKQVPSCEFFPMEAVKTNTIGGYNVINAAIENNVQRVVFLSTDKAVYPISAMGMSKAIMEKIVSASARELLRRKSKTVICTVRYGNVMYSRGSVIPYFVELIKQNKKLKVTNPSMTRFLLPLRYSVSLVLHALEKGENGSTYVRKAPASDIETLAKAVGKIFRHKREFETIGTRAGEKMHEILVSKEEWTRVEDQGDFYRVPPETAGLDYEKYYVKGEKDIHSDQGYASNNTKRLSLSETVDLLMTLPEIKKEIKDSKRK